MQWMSHAYFYCSQYIDILLYKTQTLTFSDVSGAC